MKSLDSKSGMLSMGLTNAMFLMRGKPEAGSMVNPETGFYINEPNLDDSMSDQVSHLYGHLNNLIVVLNQHGAILNNLLHREKELINPGLILKNIFDMGKAIDPSGIYDASDAFDPEKSLQPLKNKLQELASNISIGEEKQKDAAAKIDKLKVELESFDTGKPDKKTMDKSIKDSSDTLLKSIESSLGKMESRMKQVEQKAEERVSGMTDKLTSIEKEVSWKIKDCEELLKLRPTTAVLEASLAGIESKIRSDVDDILNNRRSEHQNSTKVTAHPEENFGATNKSFSDIYEKLHVFENQ